MASSRDNLLVARFAVPEFDSKAHGVALDWNEKIALVHCKNFMKALRAKGFAWFPLRIVRLNCDWDRWLLLPESWHALVRCAFSQTRRGSSGLARPAARSLHSPHGSAHHRRSPPQSICPPCRPPRRSFCRCRSSPVRPSRLVVCRRRYLPHLSVLSVRLFARLLHYGALEVTSHFAEFLIQ